MGWLADKLVVVVALGTEVWVLWATASIYLGQPVPLLGWEPGPAGNWAGAIVFFVLASAIAPFCTVTPFLAWKVAADRRG